MKNLSVWMDVVLFDWKIVLWTSYYKFADNREDVEGFNVPLDVGG